MSLACFMYKYKSLQDVQLPQEHLSFLQNFIITKYLKEEVDDDLSVCINECSPCGLAITRDKGLSMSCDQKVMTLLLPIQKCPIVFYLELLLLLKFDNSNSSVTRGDYELMTSVLSEVEYPMKLFQ